jgi:hypothetical protein
MRRSHLVLSAVALSAAAVTGSAFTAANSVPPTVAGYGENTVSGATITDIDYVAYASDNTDVETVVFQSSTDVTGKTATLTLKMGTTPVGLSPYACTLGGYAAGTMDITCDTSADHPDFDSFDTVGLTVVD